MSDNQDSPVPPQSSRRSSISKIEVKRLRKRPTGFGRSGDVVSLPELPRAGSNQILFALSRFAHHREHFALDLCRQFSDAVQISRFHQICRLYRRDAQCLPILINRHTTGQNN